MNYGATYSTDPGSFGEITAVFEVEEGWDGFRFHGYCVPTDQEVEKFFSWPPEMTDKQLVALEARAEAEHRAEQARRIQDAMKAVDEVSTQRYRTSSVWGVVPPHI